MVKEKRTITCDCCSKEVEIEDNKYPNGWYKSAEMGDLCSVCASQWESTKSTFITMRRKDTKGSVV